MTRRQTDQVQIDEARIWGHLDEMVRGKVEEALKALLDAEAERRGRPNLRPLYQPQIMRTGAVA